MKFIKSICLAAITALALSAALAVGSAAAAETTLCESVEWEVAPYCPSADRYPAETSFSATPKSGTSVVINTSLANVTCTESTLSGQTTAASGEPLPLSISGWTLGGCGTAPGKSNCTSAAVESSPYSGALTRTDGVDGTFDVTSGGAGNPGWTFKCGTLINCTLTLEPQFDYDGNPVAAEFGATGVPMKKGGGFFCPTTATFSATYTVQSPKPARLALPQDPPEESATGLCASAENFFCEPGDLYASGTALEGEGTVVFDFPSGFGLEDIECSESTVYTKTSAAYGEPTLPVENGELLLEGCKAGSFDCWWKSWSLGSGEISGVGNGIWTRSADHSVLMECAGSNWKCNFTLPAEAEIELAAGEPGAIDLNGVSLEMGFGLCPESAELKGNLALSSPSGLLVVTDVLR